MESSGNCVVQGAETVDQSCTEIIIVRHGETEWNALGKMQGQADIDLNETGKQQAKAVAERLSREPGIIAVYSSDLKRALETAETISASCHGLEVITDQDLRERHIGELEGLVYQDLPKLNPKAYDALRCHGLDQEIPGGGESHRELYRRCTSSLQRIGEKHRGQRVIVVTHGAVIETLYKRVVPEGKYDGVRNASVGIIQLSEGDSWLIKLWNDVSHLSDISLS
ncbi:phosphoglycerate mutase-like protein 4 [Silene latifolia]|uniref:phosphoglycerate mutase-like protein 4 n=1 Tax=Silene latifolia TaxID=37657 RepID=UPI003D774CB3